MAEAPLADNPLADWSGHLFNVGRTQYIILTNTASLYTCVMQGKGNPTTDDYIRNVLSTLRDLMADDGLQLGYRKHIAPYCQPVIFAKPLNRSVIGSMNDLIRFATDWLEDGKAASEVGYQLNAIPFSALVDSEGKNYAYPKDVFRHLIDSQP